MIDGDITRFLAGLGAQLGDPRLDQAIALGGGEYETDTWDEDTYLVMQDRGIEFLLTGGVLSSVFFHAEESDDHRVYGSWDTLVEGVGLNASPDDVVRALGEPLRSTNTYLTYEAGQGYVQFDFDGDTVKLAVAMHRLIGDR